MSVYSNQRGDLVIDEKKRLLGLDLGLLITRVSLGLMMCINHGVPKLSKFGDEPVKFADPLGLGAMPSLVLAVGAEVLCALLIVIGLGTRLASAPLVITMLVAAFIVHGDDPFSKKEFALVYAIPFLTLMLTGPGKFSLDELIYRKRMKTS